MKSRSYIYKTARSISLPMKDFHCFHTIQVYSILQSLLWIFNVVQNNAKKCLCCSLFYFSCQTFYIKRRSLTTDMCPQLGPTKAWKRQVINNKYHFMVLTRYFIFKFCKLTIMLFVVLLIICVPRNLITLATDVEKILKDH